MGLVSACAAIRVLQSITDPQRVFLLCVALVCERLCCLPGLFWSISISAPSFGINSAGARGSSSPAKPFAAVRLGRSHSGLPAGAAAVPSPAVHEQTWGPQGSQQLPPLCHCCSRSKAALPTGLETKREFPPSSPSLASDQAPEQRPRVPRSQQVQLLLELVAGLVSWGAQQGHQEGFVTPVHSQIPGDCSIQELSCSPSKRL